MKSSGTLTPYLLLALAMACWSGNHVLGRAAAGHVPPFAISLFRWGIPALLLWPFARAHVRVDWPQIRSHWRTLTFLAVTGGAMFGVIQYIGLQYTSALNVSLLNSLGPVAISAVGGALFGDRLTGRQMVGIGVSLLGVLVIVTQADVGRIAQLKFNWGDLIILANMALFALYSCCLRWRPKLHWLTFMYMLAAISTLATFPFFLAEQLSGLTLNLDLFTLAVLAYVAVFPSIVAYACWTRGVEDLGPVRAGVTLHLIPPISAILAYFTLGEPLHAFHIAGFALILSGVWLASR